MWGNDDTSNSSLMWDTSAIYRGVTRHFHYGGGNGDKNHQQEVHAGHEFGRLVPKSTRTQVNSYPSQLAPKSTPT